MAEALLRVEKVCKRFGGLLAIDHASFVAESGRITATRSWVVGDDEHDVGKFLHDLCMRAILCDRRNNEFMIFGPAVFQGKLDLFAF